MTTEEEFVEEYLNEVFTWKNVIIYSIIFGVLLGLG